MAIGRVYVDVEPRVNAAEFKTELNARLKTVRPVVKVDLSITKKEVLDEIKQAQAELAKHTLRVKANVDITKKQVAAEVAKARAMLAKDSLRVAMNPEITQAAIQGELSKARAMVQGTPLRLMVQPEVTKAAIEATRAEAAALTKAHPIDIPVRPDITLAALNSALVELKAKSGFAALGIPLKIDVPFFIAQLRQLQAILNANPLHIRVAPGQSAAAVQRAFTSGAFSSGALAALGAQRGRIFGSSFVNNMFQGLSMTAILGAVFGGALAANVGIQLNDRFREAQVIMGATAQESKKLLDTVLEIGDNPVFPTVDPADAAQAAAELAKAGLSNVEVMEAIEPSVRLAEVAQIDFAEAAKATAGVINSFNLDVKDFEKTMEQFTATAFSSPASLEDIILATKQARGAFRSLGEETDTMFAMVQIMARAGLTGRDAGTSLKRFAQQISTPGRSSTVSEAFKEAGIEAFNAAGEFRGVEDIIQQLAKSSKNMTDQQKAETFLKIFGTDAKKAADAVLATEGAAEDFAKSLEEVGRQGLSLEILEQRATGVGGAFRALLSSLETTAALTFGPNGTLEEPLRDFFFSIRESLERVRPTIETALLGMVAVFRATLPQLSAIVDVLGPALSRLGGAMSIAFAEVMATITQISPVIKVFVDSAAGGFKLFADVLRELRPLFSQIGQFFAENAGAIRNILAPLTALSLLVGSVRLAYVAWLGTMRLMLGPLVQATAALIAHTKSVIANSAATATGTKVNRAYAASFALLATTSKTAGALILLPFRGIGKLFRGLKALRISAITAQFARFGAAIRAFGPTAVNLLRWGRFAILLGGIPAIIAAIVVGLASLGDGMDTFFGGLRNVFNDFKGMLSGVIDIVGGVFTGDWGRALDGVVNLTKSAWNLIVDTFFIGINLVADAVGGLASLIPVIGDDLQGAIEGTTTGIRDMLTFEIDTSILKGASGEAQQDILAIGEAALDADRDINTLITTLTETLPNSFQQAKAIGARDIGRTDLQEMIGELSVGGLTDAETQQLREAIAGQVGLAEEIASTFPKGEGSLAAFQQNLGLRSSENLAVMRFLEQQGLEATEIYENVKKAREDFQKARTELEKFIDEREQFYMDLARTQTEAFGTATFAEAIQPGFSQAEATAGVETMFGQVVLSPEQVEGAKALVASESADIFKNGIEQGLLDADFTGVGTTAGQKIADGVSSVDMTPAAEAVGTSIVSSIQNQQESIVNAGVGIADSVRTAFVDASTDFKSAGSMWVANLNIGMSNNIGAAKTQAQLVVDGVYNTFNQPEKMMIAGKILMGGLNAGMQAVWNDDIVPWLSGRAAEIQELKGPLAYDATILKPAGQAVMEGFHGGLKEGWAPVRNWLSEVGPSMKGIIDADDVNTIAIDAVLGNVSGADTSTRLDDLVPDVPRFWTSFSDMLNQAQLMANMFNVAITSTFRSVAQNAAVGGAVNSFHTKGMAVDFAGSQASMDALAAWAREFSQFFNEILWRVKGHFDHVHLAWRSMPSGIPRRQYGGPVFRGQETLVGEVGPEIFIPRTDGFILSNDRFDRFTRAIERRGNMGSINVTQNITPQSADPEAVAFFSAQHLNGMLGSAVTA